MDSRRKYTRFILCFALSISVFFCKSFVALADETVAPDDELVGYIESYSNVQTFDLSPLADLDEDDYTGGALFQVLSQRASMYFQYQGFTFKDQGYSEAEGNYLGAYKLPVYLTIGFQVERGHTYSGAVLLTGNTIASLDEDFKYQMDTDQCYIGSFVFSGYEEVSPESVDVSVYPVLIYGSEADYTININFNNYQSTFDGYVYVNLTLHFDLATIIYSSNNPWWVQRSIAVVNTHATDWAGTLKDYPTNAIVDSEGSLIHNQTVQQQQIAEQQAQQSAQQHEDLKNGFQDDTYNSNVSNAGNTVDSYISVESDLMNSQNQIMSNYTDTAFNTGIIAPFTNAIAMCSTWYTWIWNSFADLNVAFVVVLAVGVACLIVGIKKRG